MTPRAAWARAKTWLALPRSAGEPYRTFAAKQQLAAPSRYYGDGGTIHDTGHIDVRVNRDGVVSEVWFRCQQLPFSATYGGAERVSMPRARVTGVEILDLEDGE